MRVRCGRSYAGVFRTRPDICFRQPIRLAPHVHARTLAYVDTYNAELPLLDWWAAGPPDVSPLPAPS